MQKPAWITKRKLLIGVIAVFGGILGVFVAGTLIDYVTWPKWTGIEEDKTISTSTATQKDDKTTVTTTEKPESGKTLWDLLSVLVVPVSVVGLGFWLQRQEQKRTSKQTELERERTEKQAKQEKARTEQQAKQEKEIAAANQREEALQAYFDRLSTLLVDKNLIAVAARIKKADEAKQKQQDLAVEEDRELLDAAVNVIRARTLSILRQFGEDGGRKSSVIRFLLEAEVISKLNLDLSNANLSGANLSNVNLSGANLSKSDLSKSDLSKSDLSNADLGDADLSNADLNFTDLSFANLTFANLSGANLSNAGLFNTNLSFAYLNNTDLKEAREWTEEQFDFVKLCRTQLPIGCNLDPNRDCKKLSAVK